MRFHWSLAILGILLCPIPLLSQEWTFEADLVFASTYEWRGLQLDRGPTAQYAAYGSFAWPEFSVTMGAWTLTDISHSISEGLPHRWASETNPWIEAAVGGNRRQLFLGAVGYLLRTPGSGALPRRGDTWEVYAGARGAFPKLPLVGEAVLFWDMDRVGGGYGELAATLQIPVWNGLVVPVGSIFLEGRGGFALGQERTGAGTDPRTFLFEDPGLTHFDVSLRTTLLPLPLGPASASFTFESHWVHGLDPETELTGFRVGGATDPTRWSWAIGLRLTLPRCRPERELCRDL